jgi:hypothetical protein
MVSCLIYVVNAPAVIAVTQVVYKNDSWVNLTREVENPAKTIYQPQGVA